MDSGQKAKQISYATDQRLDITFYPVSLYAHRNAEAAVLWVWA